MNAYQFSLIVLTSLLLALPGGPSLQAQNHGDIPWNKIRPTRPSATPPAITDSMPSFYKRKADWRRIIDEYWGPGAPLAEKQRIFNMYADYIQRYFTVFEGLDISWDSLRAHYYSQINDSTSHGRFSAILSYLAYHLRELHTAVLDFSLMSRAVGDTVIIANPSWGKPLWLIMMPNANHFGAALTPAADSSAIVVRAMQNHPLSLNPGDVVLGYEGVPWRKIAREFLAAEIPSFSLHGGSRSMEMHHLLGGAGFNWHLFDTIDIVKYPTGDTLHLPVDTLATIRMTELMYNNESLKIPGVPWPDWNWIEDVPNTAPVTHGIAEGTNIGYIYVSLHTWRFRPGNLSPDSDERFSQAVAELRNTDGLIIDLRHDHGGRVMANFNRAFGTLLNFDTHTLEYYQRASTSDLTALTRFTFYDPAGWMFIDADEETVYDRPIAVLVGPGCMSMGDVTAYRLTYFPNTRFFGKSTSMGWAGNNWSGMAPQVPGYELAASDMVFRDYYDPSRDLVRTEFPVDEEVWLTQEDVAKGEDTMVKRALAWIKGVAHAHQVATNGRSFTPTVDSLRLIARVENPQSHTISVKAYFKVDSTVVDSAAFADDGQHGDGASGDAVWGTFWQVPAGERFYSVTTRVTDPADPSTFSMPHAARFTTAGLIAFRNMIPERVTQKYVAFRNTTVHNHGSHLVVPGVTGRIRKLKGDTVIDTIYNAKVTYGDIPPDSIVSTVTPYTLTLLSTADTVRIELGVDFASNAYTYWSDTLAFLVGPVVGLAEQLGQIPREYVLHQNYPNPFNPSTTIKYELPKSSEVRLSVFDLLGQEVGVLVNGEMDAGYHEVKFDASKLASGFYLYRMQAGSYVETRKLLMIR
jgi:hypothetical protein